MTYTLHITHRINYILQEDIYMPTKRTHNEFISIMALKRPDLEVTGVYNNNTTPISVKCISCGYEWGSSTPHNLLSNSSFCPYCTTNSKISKHTPDSFIKELYKKRSDIEVVGEFKGVRESISVQCKKCGNIWDVSNAYDLLYGHSHCQLCSRRKSDKKSNSIFIQEMKEIRPDITIVGEYVNSKTPIKVKCATCGYEWSSTTPSNLSRGVGVCQICHPKKHGRQRSDIEFHDELFSKRNDVTILGKYVNNKTPLKVLCKNCGAEWESKPAYLLSGSGKCPTCFPLGWDKVKSKNSFIDELAQFRPDIRLKGEYINSKTPVVVECISCGYQWNTASPNVLLKGISRCSNCFSPNRGYSHDEFLKRINSIRNDITISGIYRDYATEINVECKTCGYKWKSEPYVLLQGYNKCIKCNPECNKKLKTISEYKEEISKINPYIEVLSKEYNGAHKHLEFKCKICNQIWMTEPHTIRKGSGCPFCDHTQTSFMEQYMYLAFVQCLGSDKVLSRDKKLIGKELDIYIPSLALALEPGNWKWHKSKISDDALKRKLCDKVGVKLITIYDSCPIELTDVICINSDLSRSKNHEELRELIITIFNLYNLDISAVDWDQIYTEAYKNSRKTKKQYNYLKTTSG